MVARYYDTLTRNNFVTPNFCDLMRIAESILNKEPDENKRELARLKELDARVPPMNIELAKCELIFYKNAHKGIQAEVEISGVTYHLGDLWVHINAVIKEMTRIVSEVAYKYDLEIPIQMTGSGYKGNKQE
jgi:hypothetical protein